MTKAIADYMNKTITYKDTNMSFWLWLSQPYFIKRLQWNRSEHWNGKFYWKWYEMINPFCTYQSIQAKVKAQKIVIKAVEKKKPTIIYPADKYIKVNKKPTVLKFKGR